MRRYVLVDKERFVKVILSVILAIIILILLCHMFSMKLSDPIDGSAVTLPFAICLLAIVFPRRRKKKSDLNLVAYQIHSDNCCGHSGIVHPR